MLDLFFIKKGAVRVLKLPRPLDRSIKEACIKRLDEIQEDIGIQEIKYLRERLPKVYKRLTRNSDDWLHSLGTFAKVMLINTKIVKKKALTAEGRVVASALYYLVDPMDVIPDHDPEMGYYDDAFVLTEAFRRLKRINRSLYSTIEQEYQREMDGHR